MKRLLFFVIISLQGIVLLAQPKIAVYTPSTNATSIYSTLDAAYTAAVSGDHIYLPGGTFSLTNPISKTIHIYGAGSNQDSSAVTGTTTLDTIVVIAGADNGSIEGVSFTLSNNNTPSIHFDMSNSINGIANYTISSCNLLHGIKLTASVNGSSCSSFIIRNNRIGSFGSNPGFINTGTLRGALVNSFVSNNTILGYGANIGAGNIFLNNVFYGSYWFVFASFGTYQNNIFQDIGFGPTNVGDGDCKSCIFNNNINVFPIGGNTGTGNVSEDWNLTFVDYNVFGDLHVRSTSLAHNSGTDGKDRGIYGGVTAWKDGLIPSNPHLSFKKVAIQNDSTGVLRATFKVKPQAY